MMFVAGESGDISTEATSIVERVVQQQVTELQLTHPGQLSRANALALRRGSRVVSSDDLIFLIRDDREKVSRLLTFLSWKELRKNAKDRDEKGGADMADVGDADIDTLPPETSAVDPSRKAKGARIVLPWDVEGFYGERVPELEDEEDQDKEANDAQLRRLRLADERTKDMTREEYAFWAECRQATLTRRKRNKFREWSGLGVVTDGKVGEDVMDILGFLTFQMVQTLTEEALRVKGAEQVCSADVRGELPNEANEMGLFSTRKGPSAPTATAIGQK
ncbi:Transcription initiation protein spt3 [Neofusicoccum ribis]|uniref:Transcription initiation protein spt3 n=1 Tax=Neofusicoccum ribis TaxID=45134 RepID=A0ABR3TEC2_9PEZI